jgi:hypothetical protein
VPHLPVDVDTSIVYEYITVGTVPLPNIPLHPLLKEIVDLLMTDRIQHDNLCTNLIQNQISLQLLFWQNII